MFYRFKINSKACLPPLWIKTTLLLLTILFGVLFLNQHVSAFVFEDNFDSYILDEYLTEEDFWNKTLTYTPLRVTDTDFQTSPYSVYNATSGSAQWYGVMSADFEERSLVDSLIFYFKFNDGTKVNQMFRLWDGGAGYTPTLWTVTKTATTTNTTLGNVIVSPNISAGTWHKVELQWNAPEDVARVEIDSGGFSDWIHANSTSTYGFFNANLQNYTIASGGTAYFDSFWTEPEDSTVEITYPPSETATSTIFTLEGNYNLLAEEWSRLMVIFERWESSSTCPDYGSEEWEDEYNQGWFLYQSMPFFSESFIDPTGQFSIEVNDLRTGNYNCVRCYFINEIDSTLSTEKCPNYSLEVTADISDYQWPEYQFPFESWSGYFDDHSEKFPTSTELFESVANAIAPITDRIGDIILYVKSYFDPDQAVAKGTELGQSIPKALGYLSQFDDFTGGLPVASIFIFYVLVLAIIIAYKVILQIIKLIKP